MLNFEGSSPVAEDIEGPSSAAEEIAFAKLTGFTESQSKTTSDTEYDVFINHRGKDVKNTLASLLYHNLHNKKLKAFLDNKAMQHGDSIQLKIQQAISTASVHIAIFSENYAESVWCLSELCLMEESGAPIIPIFCGVQPSDLRMKDENEDRQYSKALDRLSQTVDRESIEKWRATLLRVSYKYGFQFEGDHGRLLEDIAECVMKHIHTKQQSEVRRLIFGIFFNACWIFLGLCWEGQDMPHVLMTT